MKQTRREFTTVEIFGAPKLLDQAWFNEFDQYLREEFFYCDSSLSSTSKASGYPIEFFNSFVSHMEMLDSGVLILVCYDDADTMTTYKVEESGFTPIEL